MLGLLLSALCDTWVLFLSPRLYGKAFFDSKDLFSLMLPVEEFFLSLLDTDRRSHDVPKYGKIIKDTTCQNLL